MTAAQKQLRQRVLVALQEPPAGATSGRAGLRVRWTVPALRRELDVTTPELEPVLDVLVAEKKISRSGVVILPVGVTCVVRPLSVPRPVKATHATAIELVEQALDAGAASGRDVERMTGLPYQRVSRLLWELHERGRVVRTGGKRGPGVRWRLLD